MHRIQQFQTQSLPAACRRLWQPITFTVFCAVATAPPAFSQNNHGNNDGPVRMARVVVVSGDVDWRHDPRSQWAAADRNEPLREGAQLSVPNGGRAEIAFDDGSRLRLGGDALCTLQTLYSDADGEFTEVTMTQGPAVFRLMNQYSVYQINTPSVSIKASGPARFRITAGPRTGIVDWQGKLAVDGPQGSLTLAAGQCLNDVTTTSQYHVVSLPRPDSFDTWSQSRDRNLDHYYTSSQAHHYLPANIALASDELDDYGTWRHDSHYGEVWCPRARSASWSPYNEGDWVWEEPYGWTWVADEPWGWAPYHYGTWVHASYGWGWCPGPRYQYWSPANVAFVGYGDSLAWAPLAPAEIVYPSTLSIGFHSGDWSLFFSIGQAGYYYPSYYQSRYAFIADPWPNYYVNRAFYYGGSRFANHVTINNYYGNNYYFRGRYVPVNARYGGASWADTRTFGRATRYQRLATTRAVNLFSRGRLVGAPPRGQLAIAGPRAIRPSALSLTSTRSYRRNTRVSQAVLNRPVYRAPLRSNIARASHLPVRTLAANRAGRTAMNANSSRANAQRAAAANRAARTGPGGMRPGQSNAARMAAAQRAQRARIALGLRPGNTRTGAANRIAAGNRPAVNAGARANRVAANRMNTNRVAANNRSAEAARTSAARRSVGMRSGGGANRIASTNRAVQANRVARANRAAAANRSARAAQAVRANRVARANQAARANRVGQANRAARVSRARTAASSARTQRSAARTQARARVAQNRSYRRQQAARVAERQQAAARRESRVGATRRQIAEHRPRPNNRSFYRQQQPSNYGRQHAERNYRQSAPRPIERTYRQSPPRSVERQRVMERPQRGGGGGRQVERGGGGGGQQVKRAPRGGGGNGGGDRSGRRWRDQKNPG